MATCRHKGKGIIYKYLIFNIINNIYFCTSNRVTLVPNKPLKNVVAGNG